MEKKTYPSYRCIQHASSSVFQVFVLLNILYITDKQNIMPKVPLTGRVKKKKKKKKELIQSVSTNYRMSTKKYQGIHVFFMGHPLSPGSEHRHLPYLFPKKGLLPKQSTHAFVRSGSLTIFVSSFCVYGSVVHVQSQLTYRSVAAKTSWNTSQQHYLGHGDYCVILL